jgi:hypothetical protein
MASKRARKPRAVRPLRLWCGIVDGRPYAERITDSYVNPGEAGAWAITLYMSKREARRRFEEVREVIVPLRKRKGGKGHG